MRWLVLTGLAFVLGAGIVLGLIGPEIRYLRFSYDISIAQFLTVLVALLNLVVTVAAALYIQHYVVKRLSDIREEKAMLIGRLKELIGSIERARGMMQQGTRVALSEAQAVELNTIFKTFSSAISSLDDILKYCSISDISLHDVRVHSQALKRLLTGGNRLKPYSTSAVNRGEQLSRQIGDSLSKRIVDIIHL